jgi:hypothetical protein
LAFRAFEALAEQLHLRNAWLQLGRLDHETASYEGRFREAQTSFEVVTVSAPILRVEPNLLRAG